MANISIQELSSTVSSLYADSAVDIQGSSGNLFKSLFFPSSPLLGPLCDIFNKILEIGDFPSRWKEYYIVMIEKKAGQATFENLDNDLRPISIINEYVNFFAQF